MDCLFCRIAAGDEPAQIVWDTPEVVGFLDTRPVFPGHVLVIPRQHIATFHDLPEASMPALFGDTRTIAEAVVDAMGAQGTFIAMNNVVSQSVPHLHVHVVPRTKGDGLRGFFWPRTKYGDGDIERTAARIRTALSHAGS